jgi:predicted tellurium resistance membrane protein TerC
MYDLMPVHVMADFAEVVLIDLGLAGDNAVVIGLVVAGLPKDQRARAILAGMVAAIAVRIALAGAMT